MYEIFAFRIRFSGYCSPILVSLIFNKYLRWNIFVGNVNFCRNPVYNICIVTLHYDSEIYFQYIYCKVTTEIFNSLIICLNNFLQLWSSLYYKRTIEEFSTTGSFEN